MLQNIQNLFGGSGCGDGMGDNLLWFFLLLVVLMCFLGCGEGEGLLGGLGGLGGISGDNLLFFFLLLVVLFCSCGKNEDGCGCANQ